MLFCESLYLVVSLCSGLFFFLAVSFFCDALSNFTTIMLRKLVNVKCILTVVYY